MEISTYDAVGLILMTILTLIFLLDFSNRLAKIERQITSLYDRLLSEDPGTFEPRLAQEEVDST